MRVEFTKMHGLGNDFVVLDARAQPLAMAPALARALADRKTGIGCDQLIVLVPSTTADLGMRIFNADGGEVESCGTNFTGRRSITDSAAVAISSG